MDEKDHIHPLAREMFQIRHEPFRDLAHLNEHLRAQYAWRDAGCPLLTPRAAAVLEEVEAVLKHCAEGCPVNLRQACDEGNSGCLLEGIRKAWESHD